jgi:hypothetical protein
LGFGGDLRIEVALLCRQFGSLLVGRQALPIGFREAPFLLLLLGSLGRICV